MYEGVPMSPQITGGEPPIRWLGAETKQAEPAPVAEAKAEADPEAVIEFLLKKVDEQEATIARQHAAIEAQQATIGEQQGTLSDQAQTLAEHQTVVVDQAVEVEQLRGQLQVTREELDRQLGDYEVMMQNALATEQELDARKREVDDLRLELDELKQRAGTKPKISLPFHTEQKLAKLGWGEAAPEAAEEREAV